MRAGKMNLTSPTSQAVREGLSWPFALVNTQVLAPADESQLRALEFLVLVAGSRLGHCGPERLSRMLSSKAPALGKQHGSRGP